MSNQQSHFNLETMSGVFPGTRTQVFQRVVLGNGNDFVPNAQAAWYTDPAACVLMRDGEETPLLQLDARLETDADRASFWSELLGGLEDRNAQLRTCGTCSHYDITAAQGADGLVVGRCTFGADAGADQELARQSILGLACVHWQRRAARIAWSTGKVVARGSGAESSQQMGEAVGIATGAGDGGDAADRSFSARKTADTKTQKNKNTKEQKHKRGRGFLAKVREFVGGSGSQPSPQPSPRPFEERSGVGAGTESCFACQGRIANLGALMAQTNEGDAQTFSVWRCRVCFTFYLNNWIDRWERLDNLETEEVYYRLAPSEGLVLLREIDAGNGSAQKFMDIVAERAPLSHQIKHGR